MNTQTCKCCKHEWVGPSSWTDCPNCHALRPGLFPQKNAHAQALGRLSKGKPKNFSPEEIAKRTERLRLGRMKKLARIELTDTKARITRIDPGPPVSIDFEWGGPNDRKLDEFNLGAIGDVHASGTNGNAGQTGWALFYRVNPGWKVGDEIGLAHTEAGQ